MAKPTGTSGHFCAQVDANGSVTGTFEQIAFPEEKAEIESHIAQQFISSMNMHLEKSGEQFFLSNPQGNKENDFDFTVSSSNEPAYLELMEIAPLTGPYNEAPPKYKPYDLAKTILSGIVGKSTRYPKDAGRDIFLLLYVTHWTFALSDTTLMCLRYWLCAEPTVFRAIFTYEPLDATEGIPHWLYPISPELLGGFDPERVRDNEVLNLNPTRLQVAQGSGSVARMK